MTSSLETRELGPEDWKVWKQARLRCLADSPDAFGRTYEEEVQFPDALWQERVASRSVAQFVAERDDAVVGMLATFIAPEEPSLAWVFAMWVDPTVRREGIGRALLSRAIDWAAAHGAQHVELTVTEGNAAAQEMYAQAGFVDTGRREPLREGSRLQTLYMRREVRS